MELGQMMHLLQDVKVGITTYLIVSFDENFDIFPDRQTGKNEKVDSLHVYKVKSW